MLIIHIIIDIFTTSICTFLFAAFFFEVLQTAPLWIADSVCLVAETVYSNQWVHWREAYELVLNSR